MLVLSELINVYRLNCLEQIICNLALAITDLLQGRDVANQPKQCVMHQIFTAVCVGEL